MRILDQYDNSQVGNDCYIHDEWMKVSVFGETIILRALKVDGYREMDLAITQVSQPDYDTPKEVERWF